MDGLPIWRPTTAACDVMPPVAVRMPCATCMPWMSSGTVSLRTRITCLPWRVHSTASSAVKTTWPEAAPGDAGSPLARTGTFAHSAGIESRRQQLRQRFRIDQQQRLLRRHDLLGREVGGNHDGRIAGALAAAGLQHVELLVLNRELEVLDVLVVLLEARRDLAKLLVGLRQHLLELFDLLRRPYAGDDVLALGVDEELAVELFRAGCRAPGEADAGRRAIAGVAEHHLLHVDGRADVIGNVVDAAIFLRARVLPRAEHGVARPLELLDRILRKVLAGLVLHDLLVARDHLAQRRFVEVGVGFHAARFLHGVELVLEHVLRNLEHDVAEHLNEAAVAVGREPAVAGLLLQRFDGLVVEAEVQNRVHHAGHREFRARAHRHEQRLLRVAQLAAGRFLELPQVVDHFLVDRRGNLAALFVVDRADGRRDREACRDGQLRVRHLREAGALAAEQVLHRAIAVGLAVAEVVDVFPGPGELRHFLGCRFSQLSSPFDCLLRLRNDFGNVCDS